MKNMAALMKQAQQMQKNMKDLQNKLGEVELEGTAGGELVKVTMTCKHEVRRVQIDPSVIDADDAETLEDLVAAAINDVEGKIESYVSAEMSKISGGMAGMGLPGM